VTEAKTILVVDDDHALRQGLETVLQKRGYCTVGAEDGREARAHIERQRPDLVILDMMMPHWGGFAVLEHFQGKPDVPPFIMITANAGAKYRTYAERVGVVDYLCKPFPMDRLLAGVDRALRVPARPDEGTGATVIRCRCDGCGARIKAPVQLLGQTRACPRCGLALVVRPEPPEDEGPMLALEDVPPPPVPRRKG
jgi:DNA-binding response OmpR family regulator